MLQPLQFGKYLLLERIAVGGMAEVFVAKAFGVEGFERLIAIKKILPTMGEDSEFNTMFVDEARIAVQLAHANIVQVLELGKVDDNLFIAMEYISGRDVRQLLERFRKRGKPMPIAQACTIVAKVCEALDYAHRKRDARGSPLGIVHRDVSPQNVLVSFEGDVKLIDFGIAKAESRLQRTQAGILKGKFSYMSPEQVRGQAIDHRSDVFAVGVLLWELLCGEKLFTGDSDFAVLEKVRNGLVPLPRTVNPAISEQLETVMMKALATEVRDRYQWASELHDALVRFTLIGDVVYGSRQMTEWMRQEFGAEFDKEQKRLRLWLGITDAEVEVTPSDPMRRKPLPRLPAEGSAQQLMQAGRTPMPSHELTTDESEPLVQPPTPTGARHRVPLSKTATPPPGELRAVAKATPGPLAPPADDNSHELPTMKMDGNALAAAEKLLLEKRAGQSPAPLAFGADDEESTLREGGLVKLSKDKPARGSRLADLSMPVFAGNPRPLAIKDRALAPKLPSSLDPSLLAQEDVQPLPIARPSSQPPPPPENSSPSIKAPSTLLPVDLETDAFDVSKERTVVPRSQRTGALSRPVRDLKPTVLEPRANTGRNIAVACVVLLAALVAAWALWPAEILAPGRLVISLTPSVAADLVIDGRPAGAIPPFVWSVERGTHKVEIHANGFKPFSSTVKIASASKPTELPVALVADGPMEVEGVVLNQPGQPEVVPREPSRARWLMGKQKADDEQKAAAQEPTIDHQGPAIAAPTQLPPAAPAPAAAAPVAAPPPSLSEPHRAVASAAPPNPDLPTRTAIIPAEAPKVEDATHLRLNTTAPGADILIDGIPVGKTPLSVSDLDLANVHIVAISLVGYKPERRVAKAEDGRFSTLSLTLQPIPPSPPLQDLLAPQSSAPGIPAPQSSGGSTSTSTSTPPPAVADAEPVAANMGFLVTMTKPVAKVFIDGKDTGRWTPVVPKYPISLSPGPHTVTFETTEGHRHDEPITIEAGKTSRVIKMDL